MGRSERYGGPFVVQSVVGGAGEVVYDGVSRRFLREAPLWRAEEMAAVSRLELEFVTPLRMRTEGKYNLRPDFVAVTHALLRRIHLLNAIYGGGDGDAGWMHPLLRLADGVRT